MQLVLSSFVCIGPLYTRKLMVCNRNTTVPERRETVIASGPVFRET